MSWNIKRAKSTYALERWGEGYFDINEQGELTVLSQRNQTAGGIAFCELVKAVQAHGFSLPVLLRFPGILHDRVQLLSGAFDQAILRSGYQGAFQPIYPVKVNQQQSVIEALLKTPGVNVGLEAGSKPELLAVLAFSEAGGTVICNGYKDREYIRLALIGKQMGIAVYIVIEKLSELNAVLEEAESLAVEPLLGLRVKLSSISKGKWQNSGGTKSKFGLSTNDLLRMVERLKQSDHLDCLKLLHFHMGSQVANLKDVKIAVAEAARHFAELKRLGVPIEVVDVGGGLAVDYDGTRSRNDCSCNYSTEEYAEAIVEAFYQRCERENLAHPNLLTEAGRALTAHHAMLVTNVVEVEKGDDQLEVAENSDSALFRTMQAGLAQLTSLTAVEQLHDLDHAIQKGRQSYQQGELNLPQLAALESLFLRGCKVIRAQVERMAKPDHEVLDRLNSLLADKLFCNFSLFQSMPDSWAIQQIFPIVPLKRLNEAPLRRAVIEDLTCDSDGRIDQYVDGQGIEHSLPVHEPDGEPYLLGFFLLGAYQEILGDRHNLFGDTHSVNVVLDGSGGYRLEEPLQGDGIDELLRYVHFEPDRLAERFREKLAEQSFSEERRKLFESELIAGLTGYSYLED